MVTSGISSWIQKEGDLGTTDSTIASIGHMGLHMKKKVKKWFVWGTSDNTTRATSPPPPPSFFFFFFFGGGGGRPKPNVFFYLATSRGMLRGKREAKKYVQLSCILPR